MKNAFILSLIFIFFGCQSENNPVNNSAVWIQHSSGVQCEAPKFKSSADAVKELNSHLIVTLRVDSIYCSVCESCKCPNSLYYLVEIFNKDLNRAKSIGWSEKK